MTFESASLLFCEFFAACRKKGAAVLPTSMLSRFFKLLTFFLIAAVPGLLGVLPCCAVFSRGYQTMGRPVKMGLRPFCEVIFSAAWRIFRKTSGFWPFPVKEKTAGFLSLAVSLPPFRLWLTPGGRLCQSCYIYAFPFRFFCSLFNMLVAAIFAPNCLAVNRV